MSNEPVPDLSEVIDALTDLLSALTRLRNNTAVPTHECPQCEHNKENIPPWAPKKHTGDTDVVAFEYTPYKPPGHNSK